MTTLQISEITDGKKKNMFFPLLIIAFLKVLLFPFRLIFRNKNYTDVKDCEWIDWNETNGQIIKRKLIAETGFDNCIKFYQLQSPDKQINNILNGKIFGEFYCETSYGMFLRQFDSPNDWPTSYLVFIDKSDCSYRCLRKSKSSWPDWTYEFIDEKDFNIITESCDTYTTRIQIKVKTN